MKALTFLVGQGDALARFLTLSGLGPDELRRRVGDPELLGAVLEFMLGDDELLIAFARDEGIDPHVVHRARRALPGAAPDA